MNKGSTACSSYYSHSRMSPAKGGDTRVQERVDKKTSIDRTLLKSIVSGFHLK